MSDTAFTSTDARVLVRGNIRDAAQVPLATNQLRLKFTLSRPGSGTASSVADGVLFPTAPIEVSPDSRGDFSLRLVPNDLIQGDTFYQVRAEWLDSSSNFTSLDLYRIFVPMTGGWINELVDPSWGVAQIIYAPTRPVVWPAGAVWIDSISGEMHQHKGHNLTYLGNVQGPRGVPGKEGEPGLPGVNAVENDQAVAAYIQSASAQTRTALLDLLAEERRVFDFGKAELEFGAVMQSPRMVGPAVMQSVQVVSRLGGELWYTQVAAGTTSARESTRVVRCNSAGGYIGEMVLTDAGHGTGMFVEADQATGEIWVWSASVDYSITGDTRHFTTRVPWRPGGSYTTAQQFANRVRQISQQAYKTCHFDEYTDVVGVRSGSSGSYTFEAFDRAALLAGTAQPMHQFTIPIPGPTVVQGWTFLDGYWYVYGGSSPSQSPYRPAVIYQIDPASASVVSVRDMEEARKGPLGVTPAGWSEPEGISVGRGPKGEPSLVIGMSMGPLGGRSYTMLSLHMGVVPFKDQMLNAASRFGDTDYRADAVLSYAGNFNGRVDSNAPFRARVQNGEVKLTGVVNGSFTSGQNVVGQLRDGFYSTARVLRGAVSVGSAAGAEITTARCELNRTGQLSVFLGPGAASVGWADFNGFFGPVEDWGGL